MAVTAVMNVILQGDGEPFGILEVDSRSEGEFTQRDIAFLQEPRTSSAWRLSGNDTQRRLNEAFCTFNRRRSSKSITA